MKKAPIIFLFASVLIAVSFAGAVPAQAGLLEFFFPSLKKAEYDPSKTMQAPFALDEKTRDQVMREQLLQDPNAVKNPPPKFALPENNIPLDQPHRHSIEIAKWLTTGLSEVMTFDRGDYSARLEGASKYFTVAGKEQYIKFLTDNNILKVLESGKYEVRSFVQEDPLLLNEGAVNGTFHWLFEVPVMVSYVERGTKNYKNVEPVNQPVVLTVQIGRTATDNQGVGVLIERFEGRAVRRK